MSVLGIALRSLRHRALSTVLTAIGVALGIALWLAVSKGVDATKTAYFDAARGYDLVIAGPRTTAHAAVMTAVFHRGRLLDTVPKSAYEDLAKDPRVLRAVPCAVGDSVGSSRVVGTTPQFFDAIPDAQGRPLRERIVAGGRVFGGGAEFEAVVGSYAAARNAFAVGSKFRVMHGMERGADAHEHDERWTVVGVLEPTGTPNDQAVFITMGSFFEIEEHKQKTKPGAEHEGEHDGEHGEHDHEHAGDPEHDHDHDHEHDGAGMAGMDDKPGHDPLAQNVWAVSTILVQLKTRAYFAHVQFAGEWNRRTDSSASVTHAVISDLFQIVSGVDALLRVIASLVLVVAGLSILSALYNSIQGRRREIAILRALGARRAHVFSVVVLEAVLVCLLGGIVGIALGHLAIVASAPALLDRFGVRITTGFAEPLVYLSLLAGLVGIGVVAGALPAWRAYRVPVAKNLHPID